MTDYKFDLFVVGGGSGGVRAARVASSNGLKVGLAEGWDLGGTCVNRGCVPKKLYSYASHIRDDFDLMDSFGWSIAKKKFSWNISFITMTIYVIFSTSWSCMYCFRSLIC